MLFLEETLRNIVDLAILLFEYIGVGIIIFAGVRGIIHYIKRDPNTKLLLAKGLAMGLEFKLGSEILRTVVDLYCGGDHCAESNIDDFDSLGD